MSTDGDGRERERADDEVDAAWADIVARLGPLGEPGPEPPHGQDHAGTEPAATPPAPPAGPRDHVVGPEGLGAPAGERPDDADDADDHYVPEDPAPLRGAGLAWWAPWLALVGAPVLLAVVALARGSVPTWLLLAAVAAFTAGAVAAVMRLPSRTDDGPGGDGAVL